MIDTPADLLDFAVGISTSEVISGTPVKVYPYSES